MGMANGKNIGKQMLAILANFSWQHLHEIVCGLHIWLAINIRSDNVKIMNTR